MWEVDGDAFAYARRARGFPAGGLERIGIHVVAWAPAREEIVLGRSFLRLSGRVLGAPKTCNGKK